MIERAEDFNHRVGPLEMPIPMPVSSGKLLVERAKRRFLMGRNWLANDDEEVAVAVDVPWASIQRCPLWVQCRSWTPGSGRAP